MINDIINLVKEHAGDFIESETAIQPNQKQEAIETTANSLVEGLKNEVKLGNVGGLMGLLNNKEGIQGLLSNEVVINIMQHLSSALISKFNLDEGAASNISSKIIPQVIDVLTKRINDPNDNTFDVQKIMSSFGGMGSFGGMLGGFFK